MVLSNRTGSVMGIFLLSRDEAVSLPFNDLLERLCPLSPFLCEARIEREAMLAVILEEELPTELPSPPLSVLSATARPKGDKCVPNSPKMSSSSSSPLYSTPSSATSSRGFPSSSSGITVLLRASQYRWYIAFRGPSFKYCVSRGCLRCPVVVVVINADDEAVLGV